VVAWGGCRSGPLAAIDNEQAPEALQRQFQSTTRFESFCDISFKGQKPGFGGLRVTPAQGDKVWRNGVDRRVTAREA
jgi:hypothetical protein